MQRRVMIIDDDPTIGQLIGYQLREAGYAPSYEPDPLVALGQIAREQPDLVLLDAIMPQINGWELCARIRRRFDIPIIMVTGRDDDNDVVSGLHAGADDYVVKPFSTPQLLARIEAVLRRAERQHPPAPAPGEPPASPAPSAPNAPRSPNGAQSQRGVAMVASSPAALHGGALAPHTDAAPPAPSAAPERVAASQTRRLGTALRERRIARGLSLYQVERACGIRWEFLQAIEHDNYAFMPRDDLRRALRAYTAYLDIELDQRAQRRASPGSFGRQATLLSSTFALVLVLVVVLSAYLL